MYLSESLLNAYWDSEEFDVHCAHLLIVSGQYDTVRMALGLQVLQNRRERRLSWSKVLASGQPPHLFQNAGGKLLLFCPDGRSSVV